jgi:hypothetical protein
MTNEYQVPEISIGALDPNTWEEPKELIPVEVVVSEYRICDPKYMAATTFRNPLPRPIWQWDFQMKRLDAEYALLDGSRAPVTVFAGVDLEKLQKDGTLQKIAKTRSKEQYMVGAWTKHCGAAAVIPSVDTGRKYDEKYGAMAGKPILQSSLVGMKFLIARYREKDITGNGFFAKNVVEPVETLPPTYTYTGDVHVFQQKRQDEVSDGAVASAAAAGFAGSPSISKEDAATLIGEFVNANNLDITNGGAVLGAEGFPSEARIEPFISAIAGGTGRETLEQFGVVV